MTLVSAAPLITAGLTLALRERLGPAAVAVSTLPMSGHPSSAPGSHVVVFEAASPRRLDIDHLRRWVDGRQPVVLLARDEPARAALVSRHPRCSSVAISATNDHIVAVITAAAAGSPLAELVDPALRDALKTADLSSREVEILARIASGWSNQEVADELYLSINTIKTHIRSAYRKLEVSRRSQAVLWCVEHHVPLVETVSASASTR